jgi:hypothetical protein
MWTITAAGMHRMTEDERRNNDSLIGGWQQMETESLEDIIGGAAPTDEPAPMPKPIESPEEPPEDDGGE